MVNAKPKDFIEVSYVGKVASTQVIFDLTDEKLAKEQHIYNPNHVYRPLIICIGEAQILKGIDDNLVGKEVEKTYHIDLNVENAFGKKDPKLIKIIPSSVFHKQNIDVFPGMQVTVDRILGIVRVVRGGRVIVDFNHPIAGKDVYYELTIIRIIEDKKEEIESLFKFMGISAGISLEGYHASISLEKELPEKMKKDLSDKIKRLVKVESVEFSK